ncbi:sulfotransferase 1C2 [Trichonephila clavata]|uniref:Sulfotransferase 1C2 n=1 Tax=Trichonephila clavata TaxID=2740835 RepID=A0A8X6KS81_TRICU|nr:sulfotransferase 1C2 [Trichonephila clavata]
MAEPSSEAPASQFVDGFQIPAMFPAEAFRSAVQYKPRPDDVFIVTYPKCGTTWTQHTVTLIFSHGEPTMSGTDFFSSAPFLEITGLILFGGRLENSDHCFDVKRSVLFPKGHKLTEMIFWYYRLRNLHCGPQTLLHNVRQEH